MMKTKTVTKKAPMMQKGGKVATKKKTMTKTSAAPMMKMGGSMGKKKGASGGAGYSYK